MNYAISTYGDRNASWLEVEPPLGDDLLCDISSDPLIVGLGYSIVNADGVSTLEVWPEHFTSPGYACAHVVKAARFISSALQKRGLVSEVVKSSSTFTDPNY